ncbi:glutamine synthetase family protein [Streptomyces sp. Qhu-G9]|uniref:glutamine synthetase family protein n=1 Tax=Streptomyces sp. Qhu-G9 TaxID=3452799 RepID=UPI0022ABC9F5|nr:glutamine synthetase family protein [Streptomyces aurantiacus]WAU79972.1 glutamine synthetase family protein [Streptomyces aurantiacus]
MGNEASPSHPAAPVPLLTVDELRALVPDREVTTVMVAVPDMAGRLKGKRVEASHFLDGLPAGPEMCKYVLATDVDMNALPGYSLAGWHEGFGDLRVIPNVATIRRISYLPGTVLVHGDAVDSGGWPVEVAPREMLRRQLEALTAHGLHAKVGIESEFVLYKGTPTQVRRRGYRDLTPVSPFNLDYALDHPPALSAFFSDLQETLHQAGSPAEAIKTEGSPGQIEVTWPYGDPMRACDTYTVQKHAVRHLAAQHRMTPTFMAAPQTGVGSGMHLHISLWTDNGEPAFGVQRPDELPELLEHSLAGLLSGLPGMALWYAPTLNSYKRYVPRQFAPTAFTWGWDNRTCAIRAVGHAASTHLEVRLPGADANPYLALAATIAAINHGISDQPELPEPCTGDAYETHGLPRVPRNLDEAVFAFLQSKTVTNAFGLPVVDHYTRAAGLEIAALAGQVTDVERERGFDRA